MRISLWHFRQGRLVGGVADRTARSRDADAVPLAAIEREARDCQRLALGTGLLDPVVAPPGYGPFQGSRATRGYVTSREDRVYCLAELGNQYRFLQDRSVTVCFRSASCSVADKKEKRQATLGDDLGDGADL